jgi:hypothetical protein
VEFGMESKLIETRADTVEQLQHGVVNVPSESCWPEERPAWRVNQAIMSPLPVKRRVGRPKQIVVDSENMNVTDVDDRENSLETSLNRTDADTAECQTDTSVTPLQTLPGKTRGKYNSYSQEDKEKILELVKTDGLRAIAQKYNITEKSFRENPFILSYRSKLKKGARTSWGGRKVRYGNENDRKISTWVQQQRDDGLPVSKKSIQAYALCLLRDTHPDFIASEGWFTCFMRRHKLTHIQTS